MKIKKNCTICGKEIYQVAHSKGICGSCRTKIQWQTRNRHYDKEALNKRNEKLAKTMLKKYPEKFSTKTVICPCGKEIIVNANRNRKYCSEKCQHKYSKPTWNEENKKHLREAIVKSISEGRWKGHNSGIGGFREDIGHYVRSTFEANYARILKIENKDYEFEKHSFECEDCSFYIPDFFIKNENTFVEIKGRLSDTKGIKKFKEISSKEKSYKWLFIGPNEYEELCKQYSHKIKNWETKTYNIKSKNWKYE